MPGGAIFNGRKRKSDQLPLSDKHVELLQEATASVQAGSSGDRPIKKRKSARKSEDGVSSSTVSVVKEVNALVKAKANENGDGDVSDESRESSATSSRINSDAEVTDGNADEDEDDEESDVEWESIDLSLQQPRASQPTPQPPSMSVSAPTAPKRGGVEITLKPLALPKATKKPGLTAIDRKIRLETHKLHLLCLLSRLSLLNKFCQSSSVHRSLRTLLPVDVKGALRGSGEGLTQYLKSQAFVEGLKTAGEAWRSQFTVMRNGLRKPTYWDAKSLEDTDMFDLGGEEVTLETFKKAAQEREGSRDLGAQLFVALLRSVGAEARLVCSLQVLPIGGGEGVSPPYPKNRAGVDKAKDKGKQKAARSSADSAPRTPPRASPSSRGSIRRPAFDARPATSSGPGSRPPSKPSTPAASPHTRPPPAIVSAYPVYWCEAFDTNAQKWIAVDPLVTHQVNRPQKLEPPLSDPFNAMAYVLVAERDGCIRDVTKRYAKAFNAKTRKIRLESTKEGGKWWEQVLEIYARTQVKARDQIEEAELERRVAAESIPKNVQDLKNHPIFVLERHLKREEVLLPGAKTCGSITMGRSGAQVSEYVYRRKDVVGVKSAERWWRVGRVVRVGEQAIKRVKARRRLNARGEEEDEEGETGGEMVGLYSEQQTDLYVPPSVTDGKVPKNNYGNIDVYVPSMIPAGARHLPRKGIDRIAKLLGIDYADAVIGFEFRNRIVTPVVKGIVVAEEYVGAVLVGWSCLVQEQEEKKEKEKERRALKRWRRFVVGLRIRERLQMDGGEEGVEVLPERASELFHGLEEAKDEKEVEEEEIEFEAGDSEAGFLAEDVEPATAVNVEGGFVPESHDTAGTYTGPMEQSGGFLPEEGTSGGGFLPEVSGGGGFLPEEGSVFLPETEAAGGFLSEASTTEKAVEESRALRSKPPVSMVGMDEDADLAEDDAPYEEDEDQDDYDWFG
ncbi:hypothetical protein YB2330_000784 [Saitoella coloradoensis]